MEKSNLKIEPYTISEALTALNKELPKKIKIGHLYNVIYNKVKPNLIRKRNGNKINGVKVLIEYNDIVNVYDYIILSRKIKYSTNGWRNRK